MLNEYRTVPLESEKIRDLYGELCFPGLPPERPYVYGSFVTSLDGRIAYSDSPDGTILAKSNRYDPDGGRADYWILMMLRALSDAVVMGSRSLKREPRLTARVHDKELRKARVEQGKNPVPLLVIVTKNGAHLPYDHKNITTQEFPVLIAASGEGRKEVLRKLLRCARTQWFIL